MNCKGGIFGISTWKEDAVKRASRFTQTCYAEDSPLNKHALKAAAPENAASSIDALLKESISLLIAEDNAKVEVVCGYDNAACNSIDIVKNHEKMSDVLELWTCSNLKYAGNPSSCKESLMHKIEEFVAISNQFDKSNEEDSPLEAGDKVKAILAGEGTWYFGTLQYINDDGTYNVSYDNRDKEYELEPQHVKRLTKADLLSDQSKPRALIIDSSAAVAMGKVMRDLDLKSGRGAMFSNNMLVLAPK